MATLKEWLETKDYGIGLAVLGQFSKNRVLLKNLGRKPNPDKLEYELKKIADAQGIVLTPAAELPEKDQTLKDQAIDQLNAQDEQTSEEVASGKLKIVRNAREINYDDLPEELQRRWNENRDAYKEIRATHEKLKLMENATSKDRKLLIDRIDHLDEIIRENWEVIDGWKPGEEFAAEKTVEIDHKRINANRKFISTNLKSLLNITDEVKASKVVAKLQERYDELKSVKEQLDPESIEKLTRAGIQC